MDDVLYYLVLFAVYIFVQVSKARKKAKLQKEQPGRSDEERPVSESVAEDDLTFQEALAEIKQALRGEPGPQDDARIDEDERLRPRPDPLPEPKSTALHTPPPRAFTSLETPTAAFQGTFTSSFQSLEDTVSIDPIPLVKAPVRSRKTKRSNSLAARLHSASAAREAFVLSEIFGKPGGLHKPQDRS